MNTPRTTEDRTAARAYQHARGKQPLGRAGGTSPDHNRLMSWLADKVRSAGDRIFLADDARAIASGWHIAKGRLGLSRTYRDPRFDALAACDQCHGMGQAEDQPCARCSGTGRITLAVRKVSPSEQGRV
jgi:hypothetical protein